LVHGHQAYEAGLDALEGILTGVQAHIGVDLLQRHGQVDIDVFRGVAVGDVAGMNCSRSSGASGTSVIFAIAQFPWQ